jgi:hypothetical protein
VAVDECDALFKSRPWLPSRWAAEEEAIVNALETKKKAAERHEKLVQKVSGESEELRELKEKLRAAEVMLAPLAHNEQIVRLR